MKAELNSQFKEYVRLGFKWNPETIEGYRTGQSTAMDLAKAYRDADELSGLTIDEAAAAIQEIIDADDYEY